MMTHFSDSFYRILFLCFSFVFERKKFPILALTMLLLTSCGLESSPPATLQVQYPTATSFIPTVTPIVAPLPTDATTTRPVDPSVKAMLDRVQGDRLMLTVSTLVDMRTRHVLSSASAQSRSSKSTSQADQGIDQARDWLVSQFASIRDANPGQPIDVWTQPVPMAFNGLTVTVQNVISVFQGTDVGAGVVILGAHYDSISTDFLNGDADAPGANDNASGVAAMLEIARILAPQTHKATILFVGFTAEETGRQGSMTFVKSYLQAQNPPIDVRGMINLDTIGSDVGPDGEVDQQTIRAFSAEPNDSASRQLARQLALFVSTYMDDVNIVLESAEERVGRWGDHQSFSAAGYPSMRFIEGLEDLSRQHSPRDTVDNVQPGYLMRTTKVALVAIALLADGPRPPSDVAVRDINAGQLVWTPVSGVAGYVVALRQSTSLSYDQIITVSGAHQLVWGSLSKYGAVAVGSVDTSGRMGPLTPELVIKQGK